MASLRLVVLAGALLAAACAVQGRNIRAIGVDTDITDAPWLAQIEYAGSGRGIFNSGTTCAGTVIDATHILTAAHCFDQDQVNDAYDYTRIRVGTTSKMRGGQTIRVKSIDCHPLAEFGKNEQHDLAVMTLMEPIKFDDNVQPIALVQKEVPGGSVAAGGGWGVLPDDSFAPGLQTFTVTRDSIEDCQNTLKRFNIKKGMTEGLVCVRAITGLPCAGDSGSGLWVPAKDGKPAQMFGVLHGGTECAMEKNVNFYVDILNRHNRDFLNRFFDLKDAEVTKWDAPAEPERPAFPAGFEGLFGGNGGNMVISGGGLEGLFGRGGNNGNVRVISGGDLNGLGGLNGLEGLFGRGGNGNVRIVMGGDRNDDVMARLNGLFGGRM